MIGQKVILNLLCAAESRVRCTDKKRTASDAVLFCLCEKREETDKSVLLLTFVCHK